LFPNYPRSRSHSFRRIAPIFLSASLGLFFTIAPSGRPIFSADPLGKVPVAESNGSEEIVFAVRPYGPDGHYYANFGHYCQNPQEKAYPIGGKLCRLNPTTGKIKVLLDDPQGGVRDPRVHYDAQKILFSYRPGGTEHYHLYEINIDGTGLVQLTDGPWDDIEPCYLPDGGIAFCSSRCNRWVMCWKVPVAILYRCDGDGSNIRMLSSNAVTENTPWVLPDGRILYTRWEYVDRSQLCYHHLWTILPDGSGQMVYYGNMHPVGMAANIVQQEGKKVQYGNVPGAVAMLDAKPLPGGDKIVAIFSPGHGRREHTGFVTVVSPKQGPDIPEAARRIHPAGNWRDPYPISEDRLLVVRQRTLFQMDLQGSITPIFELQDENPQMMLHEPMPLRKRPQPSRVAPRRDPHEATAELFLSDVTVGRNMAGVKKGQIKKLLVLEQLPGPFHVSPGFDGVSLWGAFTLNRILGTVPVEADGSAHFEVPAMRSLLFVALDENDLAVKRMQSFVTLQPGEISGCVGCHEQRIRPPANDRRQIPHAMKTKAVPIRPIEGVPEIVDFRRHIQPILDRHCIECHGEKDPDGDISLVGGGGVPSHGKGRVLPSYVALVNQWGEIVDGRNAHGNRPPYGFGSGASRLMRQISGEHYDVNLSTEEKKIVRLWLDSGALANGTYAIMDGGTPENPSPLYIREMKRYGILPPDFHPEKDPFDVYALDRAYWRSFWYRPEK
jgi:hypothetical protein